MQVNVGFYNFYGVLWKGTEMVHGQDSSPTNVF